MHKPRKVGSYAKAMARAVELVGVQAIADLWECSTSYVYQCSDDENPRLPTVRNAAILDAHLKAQHGETPLFGVYAHRLADVADRPSALSLDDALLNLFAASGQIAAAVQAARAPTGPGGHRMTKAEAEDVEDKIATVERQLDSVRAALVGENVVPLVSAAE